MAARGSSPGPAAFGHRLPASSSAKSSRPGRGQRRRMTLSPAMATTEPSRHVPGMLEETAATAFASATGVQS